MMSVLDEYYEALNRLVNNKPVILNKYTNITNDNVAIEAGRKKGSIKKSRESFVELIKAIDEASERQKIKSKDVKTKYEKAKLQSENYRKMYETSLSRELMLIKRIYDLESELSDERNSKIVNIKKRSKSKR